MAWATTHPGDVIILHLSDLHFGSANQAEVFAEITPFLRDHVRPDVVLITGDLVDSPKRAMFAEARTAITAACPNAKMFICAGNHDRFTRGNRWYWWSRPSPLVSDELRGLMLSPLRVHVEPAKGWQIGLIEIDSAKSADYFARGYVTRKEIDVAVSAVKQADCDICIALTHHHPLPVRKLESERHNRVRDLAQVTSLVNAGTLLEAAARAHIDMILHGHEHSANWGRYGSLELGRGEVCVLGAGSGTGNHAVGGCRLSDVSFNVIVLGADRTVSARIVSYDGAFDMHELALFDASAIRRRTLLRGLARQGEVLQEDLGTEITKSVRFTPERDITVDIEFTNWKADPQCTYDIKNSTGIPVDPVVTLTGAQGTVSPAATIAQTLEPSEWVVKWNVPPSHARPFASVQKLSYTWRGGGLLEEPDLLAYDGMALGMLRGEGFEYSSIRSRHSAVSRATLIVRLPPWVAPQDIEVRAYDENYVRHDAEEAELSRRVRRLGPGHCVMAIPYPRTRWLYALAWRPRSTDLSDAQSEFIERARRYGAQMLRAFREALSEPGAAWDLALYIPDGACLVRCAEACPSGNLPGTEVPMRGDRLLLAQAWWGIVAMAESGLHAAYDAGVVPGETLVWALPIRSLLDPDPRVLGVVRVAARSEVTVDVLGIFASALAKLLTVTG